MAVNSRKRGREETETEIETHCPSAYFIFAHEQRVILREENPYLSLVQILQITTDRWKKMDSEAREAYEEIATEERERHTMISEALPNKKRITCEAHQEMTPASDDNTSQTAVTKSPSTAYILIKKSTGQHRTVFGDRQIVGVLASMADANNRVRDHCAAFADPCVEGCYYNAGCTGDGRIWYEWSSPKGYGHQLHVFQVLPEEPGSVPKIDYEADDIMVPPLPDSIARPCR